MKNLLGVLSTIVIGSSTAIAVVPNAETIKNDFYDKSFSWNGSGRSEEFFIKDGGETKVWYTFNLGSSKSFSQMTFRNSTGSRFSWGDTNYGPWGFGSRSINLNSNSEAKITNGNFHDYLQHKIYDETIVSGLAKMRGYLAFGYAWYQEGGDYYFQFLMYQFLQSSNSFTGGGSWVDLGTNIILS